MSAKRALVLVAIAIAGYTIFGALFSRFSESANWAVHYGGEESVDRARAVAIEHGVDVTGWPAEAGVRVSRALQREVDGLRARRSRSAAQMHVGFRNPRDPEMRVGVRFDAAGSPNAFVVQRPARAGDDVTIDAARPIAERAFRRFIADANTYRAVAQEDLGDKGVRFRWERNGPTPKLVEHATAIVAGTEVRDIRSDFEFRENQKGSVVDIIDSISDVGVVLAVVFGVVLYIIAAGRGIVPHRLAMVVAAIGWLLLLIEMFAELDPKVNAIFYESNDSARWTMIIGAFIVSIPAALGVTGGYPSARRRFPEQLLPYEELLLRGRLLSRNVGAAFLTGIAFGGWIAAVPHLLRATRLFGAYRVEDGVTDTLLRSGLFPTQIYGSSIAVLIAFGVVVAFVQDKLRGRIGHALAFLLALTFLMDDSVPRLAPALIGGAIVTLILDRLFRRAGLLAIAVAASSGGFAVAAASRIVQPADAIRVDGWTAAAFGGVVAMASFAVALWGSEKPFVAWQPRPARAERERMQAEFEVARLAQERMLPATPPDVAGTSIASFCRPARQVGGDLYDFVTMSDGTVGITVADVSGKGVPAALVMTITKGLLLAASDGRSDPLETLADVNAGIHSLGNRSVFVTMLFGVFDPVSRAFRFVRAGHTPLIRRKASGDVETFSPRGVGVGMTSPRLFSALCERATIDTTPGDFLFLFSDGVTEAMNERSEEFGDERLLATIRDRVTNTMSAEDARVEVVQAVDQFRGGAAAHDDMTLVVVKC
ncbi:MAG TPA: PP2C family protein-serine/threonine phosphatase [Thermoanaerobaculia bacterium]|nr:PP2C family protein-serine/threonine phosphatase [Thermoanaerobaculia bacterium]